MPPSMSPQGGKLILALYRKTAWCQFWEQEKRFYSHAHPLVQFPILCLFNLLCMLSVLRQGKNPIRDIREYRTRRGMSWWHDQIDWLGGWPYESASPEQVNTFLRDHGFALQASYKTEPFRGLLGSMCAEYVFQRMKKGAMKFKRALNKWAEIAKLMVAGKSRVRRKR